MESPTRKIEDVYGEKVSLLRTLLECLNAERENLIHLDVKGLWSLMEEKNKLLFSIQETEKEISACNAQIPDKKKSSLREVNENRREIRRLKQEIGARVRENVSFIEETLLFFDEIISVFASGARAEYSYESVVKRQKTPSTMIFESEV